MADKQLDVELEEETLELLREIAEDEQNTPNKQLLKMMAEYTATNLISKTEQLQELLTEEAQGT